MTNHHDPEPEEAEDFVMAHLPLRTRILEWWQEATGPIVQKHHISTAQAVLARLLMWTPVAVVVFLLLGIAVVWSFTGWRAGDLAAKALGNAEAGNLRVARLQVESARRLRGQDPRVLRAAAMIESKAGNPAAPAAWEALPTGTKLQTDELREKAIAMTRFGTDEQYEQALEALNEAGLVADASVRRAERRNARGDLGRAIDYARNALAEDDTPEHRLFLARLLAARHGPLLADPQRTTDADTAAMDEIATLVDSLLDTPLRREALALGVRAPLLPPDKRVTWAWAAFDDLQPSNPALLSAAYALRDFGGVTVEELRKDLTIPYVNAPLGAQAAYANFLTASGVPRAALDVVSAKEAAQDADAFDARARALAATDQWEEMLTLAESGGNVPEALRELTRAEAAARLGRTGVVEKSVPQAVRAAVREGSLRLALDRADTMGEGAQADATLVELCGDAGQAGYLFAVARERFGRRGQFASLQSSYDKARQASPGGAAVEDYRRYTGLLAGQPVDPAETAAALAANPVDLDHRMTHAFALLQAGRPEEAWSVFDDFTVFYDELRPGHQAVMSAIVAAKGDPDLAVRAARTIDINRLTPGEYLLIGRLRTDAQ
jgi:tetratricopeptide (TPR) repeat protein